MSVQILPFDDQSRERAARVLNAGRLMAFPTDTVYGVGAHALNADAVARLYTAKARPRDRAIPVLLAAVTDLPRVARAVPPAARRLSEAFWPGPLTLVLLRQPDLPPILTAGGDTVAVRVPDHAATQHLIAALDAPLAATSANRSGGPSPVTAQEVVAQLGGRIDLILDGGPCPGGVPSTVLDLTVDPPRVLRPGPLSEEALQAFLPPRA